MKKIGLIVPPTAVEASIMADMLDTIGEYATANLMDEYIEKLSMSDGDIIKQAGFWANVWSRMKGKLKVWFIEEYKELHSAAKEVQAKIEDRIDELVLAKKDLKRSFKNYELGTWRMKIDEMKGLKTEDLLGSFDKVYGRFLQYILKFEDKKETRSDKLTPSEQIATRQNKDERMLKNLRWQQPYESEPVEISRDGEYVRIAGGKKSTKQLSRYWKEFDKLGDNKIRVKEKTTLRVLPKLFGESVWEEVREDDDYTYFKKVSEAWWQEELKKQKKEEKPEVKKEEKPEVKKEEKPEAKKEEKPETKPVGKAEVKPEKKPAMVIPEVEESHPRVEKPAGTGPAAEKAIKNIVKSDEGVMVGEDEEDERPPLSIRAPQLAKPAKVPAEPAKIAPKSKTIIGPKPDPEKEVWVEVKSGNELEKEQERKGANVHLFRKLKRKSVKANHEIVVKENLINFLDLKEEKKHTKRILLTFKNEALSSANLPVETKSPEVPIEKKDKGD